MTFLEIKHFLTLAELLHFGRASQVCHMSPSALTRSIQRMEEVLGKALFIRDNRTVALTEAGKKFREYGMGVMRDWERFREELQDDGTVGGLVSIYASVTAVYSLLPELLESYRKTYPAVHLELRTGSAEESVRQVMAGEIDVSIAALPDSAPSGLEFLPLVETDLVFIGPSDQQEPLDMATTPLVLPRSGLSRRRLDQWLRHQNIQANINTEVSGNEGILAMVRLGCGVGVVPELVLERSPFRHDVRKLDGAPQLEPYIVGLCTTRKNLRRPSIAALWKMASSNSRVRLSGESEAS